MIDWDSPKELTAFLKERNLSLKKRFGQNFLISPGAREKICSALSPERGDLVWEIGPGLGAMTHTLLDLGVRVTAFEIDRGFSRVLLELFGDNPSFRLVQGDFLDTWEGEYRQAGGPDRIIGNLPYSSGSAMIAALVQGDCRTDRLVFTLQKEVARRMTALPGGETYSSFSVLCQSVWDISYAGDIKGGSFYPVPDVVSGVVICVPHNRFRFTDRGIFDLLVRDLFASRRKTIRNNILSGNLAKRLPAELIFGAFTAEGVNLSDRGERIPVTVLAAVAERLSVERESGEPPPDGC